MKIAILGAGALKCSVSENRLRKEIQEGSTLAKVGYLKKWEKKENVFPVPAS